METLEEKKGDAGNLSGRGGPSSPEQRIPGTWELPEKPFVSIIVPVRNEVHRLEKCLESFMQQTYPHELMEVLVVDGMSDDGTREIVKRFSERADFPVRLLDNPMKQRPHALNIGIRNAKGDVIVRADAGTRFYGDYVELCVARLRTTGAWCVGGCEVPTSENGNMTQKALAAALCTTFSMGKPAHRFAKEPCYADTVYLGCWPRKLFEYIGYFDEEALITEDWGFADRIRRAGGQVFLDPKIKANYIPRSSYGSMIRTYFGYGYGRAGVLLKGSKVSLRYLAAPAFSAYLFLLPMVIATYAKATPLAIIPLLTYVVLVLAVSLACVLKSDVGLLLFPRLCLVYPIIHLSWAAGFWWGLFKGFVSKFKTAR